MKCSNARDECKNEALFIVEKIGDLSHRSASYCRDCAKPYAETDDGKKYFTVNNIKVEG